MPKIENFCGGVRVTIERTNFIRLSASGQTTTETTTERIIEIIRNNPKITNRELAEMLGITEDGVYYNTKKLRAKGVLRRVGGDFGGHWEIIDKDEK